MSKKYLIVLALLAVLSGVGYWYGKDTIESKESNPNVTTEKPEAMATDTKTVTYECDDSKTITATYFFSGPETKGSVNVSLDDGPWMNLKQTISASGIRYATEDESFVFWSKGSGAFIMRDNTVDTHYSNCESV